MGALIDKALKQIGVPEEYKKDFPKNLKRLNMSKATKAMSFM